MRLVAITALITAIACFIPIENAAAKDCPYTPAPGSAERKTIMDTLRVPVESELKQDVVFVPKKFTVCRDWAFLEAEMQQPDGRPVDWSVTPYRDAVDEGMCGGYVHALLRAKAGRWQVRVYEICASDVPWVMWADEYGAPQALFPKLD
jgi:hypothetical protein